MMQNNAYEKKYLKYKKKYLELKHGGRLCKFKVGDVVKGPERYGFGIVRQVNDNKVWADFAGINGDMWSFHRKKDTQFNKTNEKTPQEVANGFGSWYWEDESYSRNIKELLGLKRPVDEVQKAPETPQKQSSAMMTAPGAPVKQAPKAPETPQKQSSAKMTAPGAPVKQTQVESCDFKIGDVVKGPERLGFGIVRQVIGDTVWGDFSGFKGDKWSWHCSTNKSVIKTTEKTPQEVANMFGEWYWNAGKYNEDFIKSLGLKNPKNIECEFKVGDVAEAPGRYGFGIVTQITGNEVWGDFSGIKGDRWSWNCKTNKKVIKTTEKTPQEVANMFGDWYWKVGDYNKEIREKLGLEKVL